jgi:hypothetical protein
MTTWRSGNTLTSGALGENHDRRPFMANHRTLERDTIERAYAPGAPRHGDVKAGGAVAGRPVGAVVGAAIGAASGATAGLVDEKRRDDTVVAISEERRL